MPSPAEANWLTHLLAEGAETAARTGRRLPGPGALVAHLERLPAEARASAVAAQALPEGHWRLTNAAGETVTAATPEELAGALRWLAPETADLAGKRLTFLVEEETVFGRPEAIAALPERIEVRLALGARTHRVLRGQAKLYAEIERGLLVALEDPRALEEAAWQLARGFNRGEIRILALDAAGSRSLPRVPPRDPASGLPLPEAVDPYGLGKALSGLAGQTVLVSGKVEGKLLRFEPASGPARTAVFEEILAAADRADVNLILLESDSALQPGARNAFWQRAEVGGLAEALRGASLGDLLAALAGETRSMLVTASTDATGRARLRVAPAPAGLGADAAGGALDSVTELMSELAAGFAGRIAPTAIEIGARSRERQSELDARIVPGIPADIQLTYLGLLLLGVLGLPVARLWWQRLLPRRPRAAFGSALAFRANGLARLLAFALLFLPAAGALAAPAHALMQVWHAARYLLARVTSPLRSLRRRAGAT